jgi:hypothetical protein
MDFTPLIICFSVSLILASLSLFIITCYKISHNFKVIDGNKLYYDGDIYEKKN